MAEPTIACPHCQREIKLTESLAAPLVRSAREEYEQRLARQQAEMAAREKQVMAKQEAVDRATESLNQRLAEALRQERPKIAAEELKKARQSLSADFEKKDAELAHLHKVLDESDAKLADAQRARVELMRKQRELDDAKRELELTVETRLQASLAAARDKARHEAEESLGLKVAEKDAVIGSMQKTIEELKRRSEQGSPRLQGEVLELRLEALLAENFPRDLIEAVPKGEFGGDVLQRVRTEAGRGAGTILWESKRTKAWQDGWLPKLREDQRTAKADLAILVTQVLPRDVRNFALVDNVWVTDMACMIPLAFAMRRTLLEVAVARHAADGQQSKMALVYQYLTGPAFRHRVEAILEQFTEMREDLDRERKVMTRLWAKREQQINAVLETTAGMYGDLQGIAGKSLKEIDGLEVKLLEDRPPQREARLPNPRAMVHDDEPEDISLFRDSSR